MDLSFLDRPEILEVVFPVACSPFHMADYPPSSPDASAYAVEVEEGINIDCGFWASGKECPTILYFHGNGETAAGHDWIAPFYNQRGINLLVADYRGYGSSGGKPTVANMLSDAHLIFNGFGEKMEKEGFKQSLFVMGRSLGSMPAIEIAAHHQDEIRGLIIESGSANNLRRLWDYAGTSHQETVLSEESPFLNKVKIRQVHRPTLIIHGEYDRIISVEEGEELYQHSGAPDKRLLIIPGADHNDVMLVNQNLYFDSIEDFIKTGS